MFKNQVSVIIPNYNNGRFLDKCVASIMAQTLLPLEIIIVDDFSTDNSKSVINRLVEEYDRVVPVFLEENQGVSNARNRGLQKAQGEYVTFIDADDIYYNNKKLENEMDVFKLTGNDRAMAYSVTAIVDESEQLLNFKSNHRWRKREFLNGYCLPELASMAKQSRVPRDYCIKKVLLEEVGGYSYPVNFYEDLDLLFRLAQAGIKFVCTYEYGTGYRRSSAGLSRRSSKEHKSARYNIRRKYICSMKSSDRIKYELYRMTSIICATSKNVVLSLLRNLKIK